MKSLLYDEEQSKQNLITIVGKVNNLSEITVKNSNRKTTYGNLITHDEDNQLVFISFNSDNINEYLKSKNVKPIENNDIIKVMGFLTEKQAEKDGVLLYDKNENPILNYRLKGISKIEIVKRAEIIIISDFDE